MAYIVTTENTFSAEFPFFPTMFFKHIGPLNSTFRAAEENIQEMKA